MLVHLCTRLRNLKTETVSADRPTGRKVGCLATCRRVYKGNITKGGNKMEEIWKEISGYEGLYMVSNLGNVKSINYRHHGYSKNLVPKVNNSGRLWVELTKNGKRKPLLVHRLVANAFIPNVNNLPQVNHIDENTKNNSVENLEWCTGSYNVRYSIDRHPERIAGRRRKSSYANGCCLMTMRINQLTLDGLLVKTWPNSVTIMKETGMSNWSISECCRGNRHTAYGFKWEYTT